MFCVRCIENSLPFVHIYDDEEYLDTIRNGIRGLWDNEIKELNNRNFLEDQIDVGEIDLNDPLIENDPDIHFYETHLSLSKPSNYYDQDSFNNKFLSTSFSSAFLHLNIRSIPRNLNKLKAYLSMMKIEFSIIGISESWLTEDSKDAYYINGYNNIHLCRKNKRGGGVSLFIKPGISYTRHTDLDIINPFAEALFIEIKKVEFSTTKKIL